MTPLFCLTIPCTVARPSPAPWPSGFVELHVCGLDGHLADAGEGSYGVTQHPAIRGNSPQRPVLAPEPRLEIVQFAGGGELLQEGVPPSGLRIEFLDWPADDLPRSHLDRRDRPGDSFRFGRGSLGRAQEEGEPLKGRKIRQIGIRGVSPLHSREMVLFLTERPPPVGSC